MNIVKRELRAHLKPLFIWSVSLIALIAMMMSEFSAYYNNPEMADIMNSMPPAMLEALSFAGTNITTVSGFVSLASLYFYIMLGLYAALLGSSILSKEERDKTVEFFLTLPVSRKKVILCKWIAAVLLCIAINIVTSAAIYATTMQYDKVIDFDRFMLLMMTAIFILQMIFMNIGMLLAAVVKRYKRSGRYAIAILFALYIMSILISLSDKLDALKYVTPFKYFETSTILREGNLELVYVILSILIIGIALAGTFIIYPKRDLHI